MPQNLGYQFTQRITAAQHFLETMTEDEAREPARDGGWLKKEVLGHLLDSAANNHMRFMLAALNGHYEGPFYDQEAWVRLNGYRDCSWATLLHQWIGRNTALAQIVLNIPETALSHPCTVGDHAPVTLEFLITDYLDHLEHHVVQIVPGAARPQ